MEAHSIPEQKPFSASDAKFRELVERLGSEEVLAREHGEVEELLRVEGREVLRMLMQDHLALRSPAKAVVGEVEGSDGQLRKFERRGMKRPLTTIFGTVRVERTGYRGREGGALVPLDAASTSRPTSIRTACEHASQRWWPRPRSRTRQRQFSAWQSKVTVPGLPWYPAFVAWPGPTAPPMPNIPMPLIACVSSAMAELVDPSRIVDRMEDELGGTGSEVQRISLEDIATVLSLRALTWLASSMVQLVLGKGPVPTFAPPYVPVGPVVGGDVLPTPGVISGSF